MPKVTEYPDKLHPFRFHGLELNWSKGDTQALATCPFCDKVKFYVEVATGLWQCKVCGTGNAKGGGNTLEFLRQLWASAEDVTTVNGTVWLAEYQQLVEDRRLLEIETLQAWGVRPSMVTGEWLVPGYTVDGKLNQLYRYVQDPTNKKRKLLATKGLDHQLFGMPLFDPQKPEVWVCEGPWDAMALWEVLKSLKRVDNNGQAGNGNGLAELNLTPTSNPDISLLKDVNVLAVPGCNVWEPKWSELLVGKRLVLLFDNDHPQVHPRTQQPLAPAGYTGMRRIVEQLAKVEEPPSSVSYLAWGRDGADHNPSLPAGYDVRDLLSRRGRATTLSQRARQLGNLYHLIQPIPADWLKGRSKEAAKKGSVELECLPCTEWRVLVNSWRKALKWIDGLDRALSVMLASITSLRLPGDQLWTKIIGPASCGKSTLCEAISVNKKYIFAKSTIRGFMSGYQSDREGSEDNSLIARLKDKTLVTKDGDTLLQQPNLGQILAEARDLYDTTSRSHYRNKMSKDYQAVRMTWLLCGTESLRALDSSELGERFLDCIIMDEIDDELEDEIGWRAVNKIIANKGVEVNGRAEQQQDAALTQAMQLTGGYITHLRTKATEMYEQVQMAEEPARKCMHYGKFVAYMRSRPSKRQEEHITRELSTRLRIQLTRLSLSLAVVLNRNEVDEEVMRRVRLVALDTARGKTLGIVHKLYRAGSEGMELHGLANASNESDDKMRGWLKHLRGIGAVELFAYQQSPALGVRPRWRLTRMLRELYQKTVLEE